VNVILNQINKIRGVRGSIVIGRDGIVVASEMGVDIADNAVAAVASQILTSLGNALEKLGVGNFNRFTVSGKLGKIAIVGAGRQALLLVLLDKDTNMGLVSVEIKDAVAQIASRISL
jgi:predicted regulator of Ras-like GTPase activity (Roadblock/LC7/MglB family)